MLFAQQFSIAFRRVRYQFTLLQQQKRGMKAFIQIVGQHTPEGPPSIVVHYDAQRYIFNVREGTQRLCVQEKVRLGKANQIFVTRTTWDCLGGLPGLLLTLTDAGVRKINLYGGKNLAHFIAATRRFAFRTNSSLSVKEFDEEKMNEFKDNNLTIKPVIVLPKRAGQKRAFDSIEGDDDAMSSSVSETDEKPSIKQLNDKEADDYRQKVISAMFSDKGDNDKSKNKPKTAIDAECAPREQHPLTEEVPEALMNNRNSYLRSPLPETSPYPAAITYICRGSSLPRKFNKDAALALGIKPGPLYGKLHKGMDIILEDGRVITQDMVCDPPRPGHSFILVDCPSTAYIDGLIESEKFKEYQVGGKYQVNTILHFLGKDVIHDPRYKKWVASFDENTDHIFSSEEICKQDAQFTSQALCQVKLSKLDDKIFAIPKYSNTPERELSSVEGLPAKSFALDNMAIYNLEPKRYLEYSNQPVFDHTNTELESIKAIESNEEYKEAVAKARTEASKVDISGRFPGDDIEIVTLGTGSSIPSKYRNVSATLVKIPDYGSIMLDAGEGTFGQMIRRFGIQQVDDELRLLDCIFVSHLHADHHLGVIQLIRKWFRVNTNEASALTVIAPRVYNDWINEYIQVESFGKGTRRRIRFLSSEYLVHLYEKSPSKKVPMLHEIQDRLGLSVIKPIEVIHCRWAYGLSIEHKDGWKIVYSGDTRPCNKLIDHGQNATLLIHEATFDDIEKEKAIDKRHSTTGEAVDVGQRMNARYTLLNHFSQRYPKIPSLSGKQENICFSFDLMSVLIKQMPILPKFTDAMQLLFEEEEDDKE